MAEKEYIERKDLINNRPPQRNPDQTGKEEYNKGYNDGIKSVLACIENQPVADVVDVVRCKNCEHFRTKPNYCGKLAVDDVEEDFYCCYGEKRTNND